MTTSSVIHNPTLHHAVPYFSHNLSGLRCRLSTAGHTLLSTWKLSHICSVSRPDPPTNSPYPYSAVIQNEKMNLAEILLIIKATPSSTFILSLIAILVLAYVAQIFYQWQRLSHISGPFWASFSRFWLLRQAWKGRVHTAVKDACEEYGQ
jgi:hypothetical protein